MLLEELGNFMRVENTELRNFANPFFRDTERMGQIFDWDGSITGMPKSTIVRDQPFYTSESCVSKPQWGMSACPHTYVSAEDSNSGYEGTISKYFCTLWNLRNFSVSQNLRETTFWRI